MRLLFSITIFFFIIFYTYVYAFELNKKKFYVNSNKLIQSKNPISSEFLGNVYARDEVAQYWGDRIKIKYSDNYQISYITISDNVKIKRLDEEITGNFAEYDIDQKKIRVIGNVILIKDKNILMGDELIVDLINSTSIIKSYDNNQVSVSVIK